MFDLEKAVADWRRQMATGGIKSPEVLDELEAHLREDVEQQIRAGTDEAPAFELAVKRIGQPIPLKEEFAKAGKFKWAFLKKIKRALLGNGEIPFPPMENFAPAARQTLELAPAEARRFHHGFVGTEHVLLGLMQSQSQVVDNVLQRLGIASETVRAEIEKIVGRGPLHDTTTNIPFTPRARKALQLAAAEARKLSQPRLNAEHIFLGLILEGGGVAALVLKNLGVQIENARMELLKEMRANPGAA